MLTSSTQGRVLRQTLFPLLTSQFMTNRPLHMAFDIILQNFQNHHQRQRCRHQWLHTFWTGLLLMNPPAAVQQDCRSLHRASQERRTACGRKHLCLWHHSASCQPAPPALAWLGPWRVSTRKDLLFHSQTRSRLDSSLWSSWRRIYFWSILSSLPSLQASATWSHLAAVTLVSERWLKKD